VSEPIQAWPFHEAPNEFQRLSEHGGDEDWLALVPERYMNLYIGWLEPGSPFGCCDVSRHDLIDGRGVVYIGAHS